MGLFSRKLLDRLTQQHVFFPGVALLVIAIIWATTANLVRVEIQNAERVAGNSTLELLDTYEAQMLRNLREIDHTLKVVKYAYEASRKPTVLAELNRKGLLPPNLLFTLIVSDARGRVLAITRPRASDKISVKSRFGGSSALRFNSASTVGLREVS